MCSHKENHAETDPNSLPALREYHQVTYTYFRHLSSLSTGAIIVLAAFMEKVFANPVGKSQLATAIGCFLITVVASVLNYTLAIRYFPIDEFKSRSAGVVIAMFTGLFFSWGGFLFGMIFVTIFMIRNILN